METTRAVVVKHLPQKVNAKQARLFIREIAPLLNADRPQIVFEMSQVEQLDAAGVDMLLECMAEVMKRDGDLKLAAPSPHAAIVLEMTRTDRLFEIYDTAAQAVRSFTHFVPEAMRNQPFSAKLDQPGRNAVA